MRWLKWLFRKKAVLEKPPEPPKARKKVDSESIRNRLKALGWSLREVPVKHSHPDPAKRTVSQWKVTAFRGERSVEVGGATIDEALSAVGKSLGVIPQNEGK